jgi:hypothetical protein
VNIINKANIVLKIFKLSEELVLVLVVGFGVNSHLAGVALSPSPLAATNEHTLPLGTSVAFAQLSAEGDSILSQAVL